MFENLTREIILFSVIPVVLIILVDLIAFLIIRKKKEHIRFNYFLKISMIIANAFVLPLIGGYTIWVIQGFINRNILGNNLWYAALLIFLWIALFILLLWVYWKTIRELRYDDENKELEDKENKEELEQEKTSEV